MTVVEALKSLKEYLEREVAPTIELQKELSDPIEYVHPYVSIITLPHKNFVPVDFSVPYILIGLADGTDDTDEHTMQIRIMCATYGGDSNFQGENKIPDEKGCLDLLTLLERIKIKLLNETIIEGDCIIEKPVNYGIYTEEITYPYWYGYLQFSAQLPIVKSRVNTSISEYL